MATITVLKLIKTAPIAGLKTIPTPDKTPAANGNAIMLYPAAHQRFCFIFLLSCLGIAGFPITSAFLGEDLILTHIHTEQWILAALIAFTFIINGLAVIRIFARLFYGKTENNFQKNKSLTI